MAKASNVMVVQLFDFINNGQFKVFYYFNGII
jgi:hypothetical protein